jgi:hypothetical protein
MNRRETLLGFAALPVLSGITAAETERRTGTNFCQTCTYFMQSTGVTSGGCLRFPPVGNPTTGFQYPIVQTTTPACGEYK